MSPLKLLRHTLLAIAVAATFPAQAATASPQLSQTVEQPRSTSTLFRSHSGALDFVAVHRPGSEIAEIVLSLPRDKHAYTAADYESAALAVRAVSDRLVKRLARYGASVGYDDNHGTPTISVTILAEHAPVVAPLIVQTWADASFSQKAWRLLVQQEAERSKASGHTLAEGQLLGLHSGLPRAALKQGHLRFDLSRTLAVVGGPWTAREVSLLLGSPGRNLHTSASGSAAGVALNFPVDVPEVNLPACAFVPSADATAEPQVLVLLPLLTPPVSAENWPAARVAVAIAGTGYESRMNQVLRIEKGWAYGAGVPLHYRPTHTIGLARVRVQRLHATAAAQILETVLNSVHSSGPDVAELNQAKQVLLENYWLNRETISHETSYLADFLGAGMTLQQFADYPEKIESVTGEGVHAVQVKLATKAVAVEPSGAACSLPLRG